MNIIEKVCRAIVENQLNFDIKSNLQPKSQMGKDQSVLFNIPGHVETVGSPNHTFPGQAYTKQLTSTLCTITFTCS